MTRRLIGTFVTFGVIVVGLVAGPAGARAWVQTQGITKAAEDFDG